MEGKASCEELPVFRLLSKSFNKPFSHSSSFTDLIKLSEFSVLVPFGLFGGFHLPSYSGINRDLVMLSHFASLTVVVLLVMLSSALPSFFTLTPYAPTSAQCPATPILRRANGLSPDETWYRDHRSATAGQSLREWFTAFNAELPKNDSFPLTWMPTIGFASSGGSIRALLSGAGVVQALDGQDPVPDGPLSGLKGLYQGVTYHSGVEAGSWILTSRLANDDTVLSSLVNDIWISSFSTEDFLPAFARGPATFSSISMDLVAKALAGYPPTLPDTWGRVLSQHLYYGEGGGLKKTLSGMVNNTDFPRFRMPYPILTALGIDALGGGMGCISANQASPQYEFSPFEYGSWDARIRLFGRTEQMGSPSANGMALGSSTCVQGFDNLGFLIATSGNEFNYWCGEVPSPNLLQGPLGRLKDDMIAMTGKVHGLSYLDEYGSIPNSDFSSVRNNLMPSNDLYLISGAQGGENIPLWPLLQPERNIDVIIANDNSQDTPDFFPNGTSLYNTYARAREMGLKTMPMIPSLEFFVERGYSRQPTFFGCYEPDKITIIYLPNSVYTFNSNIPDWILKYSSENVTAMLANGQQVATYGGSEMYKRCLGCVMLSKVNEGDLKRLPSFCGDCMQKFCYRP